MGFSDRLAELGIELSPITTPVTVYVPATRFGDVIRASSQPPLIDSALLTKGKVDSGVPAEDAKGLARVVAFNALVTATALAGGLDDLSRVVYMTVFVSSAPDFTGQATVANGASEVLGEIFGETGGHLRSAVDVAVSPLDTPVEVEVQSAIV